VVSPHSEFKFQINSGDWLSPPSDAPNIANGNLQFLHEFQPIRIEAEIVNEEDIRLIFPAARPEYSYNPQHYVITNANGDEIPVKHILYVEPGVLLNTDSQPGAFPKLGLNNDEWKLIATERMIDHINGVNNIDKKRPNYNSADLNKQIMLPAQSLRIWIRE